MTEKNKGGRPPKYNSPEELGLMIDGYWASLELWNSEHEEKKHPTVTGLAIAVDLTRTGLLEYCDKNEEYSNTIRKAKAKIEEYVEQRLYGNNVTGLIFNLKNNYGWKDKTEVDNNLGGAIAIADVTIDDDAEKRIQSEILKQLGAGDE
tara:strand:- start:53 stop:499 length:447 start_codon:yes stop_codon:yes gene_type:complete